MMLFFCASRMISPMPFTAQIIGSEQKPDGKHKERWQISKSVSAFERELKQKCKKKKKNNNTEYL